MRIAAKASRARPVVYLLLALAARSALAQATPQATAPPALPKALDNCTIQRLIVLNDKDEVLPVGPR